MTTQLAPSDVRDTRTFDLEVLTPIHIGTREGLLKPTDFLWDAGKVHILDEDLFAEWLKERNQIDVFVEEAKTGRLNLKTFFQKPACKGWRESLPRMTRLSIPGGKDGMQELRPMVRDAGGCVYLPGTAIKGVLRTAVLYAWVKQQEARQRDADQKARAFDGKNKKFFSAQWLQQVALQGTPLSGARPGPNTDILRCLAVRDAYPVGPIETRVICLQFLSKKGTGEWYWSHQKDADGRPKTGKLEVWVEAVTAGRFRIELCWDKQLWHTFTKKQQAIVPVNGLDELIALVRDMSADVTHFELAHYNSGSRTTREAASAVTALHRWYMNITGPLIRVGFGSGMLSTTIALQLSPDARQHIRDRCAPRNGERPGDPAPKSRRVWINLDGSALPLGWARLVEPQGEPIPTLLGGSISTVSNPMVTLAPLDQTPVENHPAPEAHPERSHQPHTETWTGVTLTHQKGGGGVLTVIGATGKAEARGAQAQAILKELTDEQRRRLENKGQLANLTVAVTVQGNLRQLKAVLPEA